MSRLWICGLSPALALLGACTTTTEGLKFGLPDRVLQIATYYDAVAAADDLKARNAAYVKRASAAVDATRPFDLATIFAGTLGVAAAGFSGVTDDMAPLAGTLAAGNLGLRTYYADRGRYAAYVGGAKGTSCLAGLAGELSPVTRTFISDWAGHIALARSNLNSPYAAEVIKAGEMVVSAPDRLSIAAQRVDTEVLRKLTSPAAPDLSAYFQSYQAAVGKKQSESESVTEGRAKAYRVYSDIREAKRAAAAALAAGTTAAAVDEDPLDRAYRALVDPTIDRLVGLDERIEKCVALAI